MMGDLIDLEQQRIFRSPRTAKRRVGMGGSLFKS
jgi:hypothetical protein